MKPDVSIIIVNWNGGSMLRDCIESIQKHSDSLRVETIVVDNASSDGSRETIERMFPSVKVLNSGANLGFARANNLARPLAGSDLILFLNPDTVLLENSLHPMVEFMRQHSDYGVVGCKMLYPDGTVHEQGLQYFPTPWMEFLSLLFLSTGIVRRFKHWLPYLDPNQSQDVIKLYGGCLLCRRHVLDAVGWFDERYFMYAEDADLCHAIQKKGRKLHYLSSAAIIHIAGGASAKAPSGFSVLMKSESIGKMMAKHYGSSGAIIYRLATLLASVSRLIVLTILWIGSGFSSEPLGMDVSASLFKYRTLILWAIGARRPSIAGLLL